MRILIITLITLTSFLSHAQTKYYCANSDNKAVKDIVIAFENGIKIESLGGTSTQGTVTYNTGKNEKISISLFKIEVAVDSKGKTGDRYYYEENTGNGGTYIITEWPMQTIVTYKNNKGKSFIFYCQDSYNFNHEIVFDWYKK